MLYLVLISVVWKNFGRGYLCHGAQFFFFNYLLCCGMNMTGTRQEHKASHSRFLWVPISLIARCGLIRSIVLDLSGIWSGFGSNWIHTQSPKYLNVNFICDWAWAQIDQNVEWMMIICPFTSFVQTAKHLTQKKKKTLVSSLFLYLLWESAQNPVSKVWGPLDRGSRFKFSMAPTCAHPYMKLIKMNMELILKYLGFICMPV